MANADVLETTICPPTCECTDCQHSWYMAQEQYHEATVTYSGRLLYREAERMISANV